jgi:hypothetical protein
MTLQATLESNAKNEVIQKAVQDVLESLYMS